jgi:hypothetical protein
MIDEALVNISHLIKYPSATITITQKEVWYLHSFDLESCFYILRQLDELRYIKLNTHEMSSRRFTIEAKGWEKLSQLRKRLSQDRKQAFVAMWFDETMNNFFDKGIKPAIEYDGTKCIKIDLIQHNNKICDEIIARNQKE